MGLGDHKHFCERGQNHAGKEVVMICLNQECQAKRLCCLVCIDELHRKHELISFYKFQDMLSILTKKGEPGVKDKVVELLGIFQSQIFQQLDQSLASYAKYIQKNKAKLREVIGIARQSVNLQFTSQDIADVYLNLDDPTVCRYLSLIRKAEGEALKDPESASQTLKKAHLFIDKTVIDTNKMMVRGIEDVNGALEKLKKLIDSQAKKMKQFLFNKSLKSPSIQISADQKIAKRFQGQGGYPIALLDQPLTEFNSQFSATLKEQPGSKGCWLGVCILDIVQGLGFKSCYGLGKGTWGIDQVGASHQSAYSWSHHDPSFNSQPKVGFTFAIGETVTVRVDYQKSTVIFQKGSNKYEMPIQTNLGQIYGYVGCTHIGDIWEIE